LDIDRAGEVLVVRIWEAERKTILFVTHDIDESVQLVGRVLVMSRRPATIQQAIEIDGTGRASGRD
jgi:NitT/TauT family transport system ATP-binding protein